MNHLASDIQTEANQIVNIPVDVSTQVSNGPINFTAQIVPGQNWAGQVVRAVTVPAPADIVYEAVGANLGGPTKVPVAVNTQVLAGLPIGIYTAFLMFAASPETPASPASSPTCGSANTPVAAGTTSPVCIPIVITVNLPPPPLPQGLVFGASTTPQQTSLQVTNPSATASTFVAFYQATPVLGTALPASNVFFVGPNSTVLPAFPPQTVVGSVPAGGLFAIPLQVNPAGLKTGVRLPPRSWSGSLLPRR